MEKIQPLINPADPVRRFFYEEVVLLGRVISVHKNKEELFFRLAHMLDWAYRRYTGRIGTFENETIEQLLLQSYRPHLSTVYLLEKHFPKNKENGYGDAETGKLVQDARLIQQAGN